MYIFLFTQQGIWNYGGLCMLAVLLWLRATTAGVEVVLEAVAAVSAQWAKVPAALLILRFANVHQSWSGFLLPATILHTYRIGQCLYHRSYQAQGTMTDYPTGFTVESRTLNVYPLPPAPAPHPPSVFSRGSAARWLPIFMLTAVRNSYMAPLEGIQLTAVMWGR